MISSEKFDIPELEISNEFDLILLKKKNVRIP